MAKQKPALSLEDYLRTHRETIRPLVLVKQLIQYQEQYAENHALLGDRLLDVYLYNNEIQILDKKSDVTGDATHLRSELFSNRNLASVGNAIFAYLLKSEEWGLLSDKQRGTFVEAIVGACFHLEGRKFSEQFNAIVQSLVERLNEAVRSGQIENFVGRVHEWLQANRIADPQERFQTVETGYQRFKTTIDFGLKGESRHVTGPECQSKDDARRLAAELVLVELGLCDVKPAEVRRVEPPAPVEIPDCQLVRDGSFAFQPLECERWDLDQTLEWFSEKCKTKPYEVPFLLRAQLDNAFEIVGWVGMLEEQNVAVMTATFSGERYWSFGSDKSRNQSKKAAGRELLKLVPFEDWIKRILAK